MLTDQKLIIARLKDTVIEELYEDMVNELEGSFQKHKKEWNDQLEEYIKSLLSRFSTTEIRKVWAKFEDDRGGFIDYDRLEKLDPWLELLEADEPIANVKCLPGTYRYQVLQMVNRAKIANTQAALAYGVTHNKKYKKMFIEGWKKSRRKAIRMKRKQAKLRKKGITLYV